MNVALWAGAIFGACLGALHAAGLAARLLRTKGGQPGFSLGTLSTPAYYAVWTVVLWTLFGAYVLYLWLLGCLLYGIKQLRAVALHALTADEKPA